MTFNKGQTNEPRSLRSVALTITKQKMNEKTLALVMLIILSATTDAARVGVAVKYQNGTTYTECVQVNAGADGYQTLEESALALIWSPAGMWGHGLCGIEGVGCPSDNCYCTSDYWGFLLTEKGKSGWEYMPVGFDAPSACWNHDYGSYDGHYCAADGDVVGLAYGPWGTQPDQITFTEICGGDKRDAGTRRTIGVSVGAVARAGEEITLTIRDNNTGEGLKNAEVEVYEGVPGASKKLFEGETNSEGRVSFTIREPGEYRARISGSGYPHEQLTIRVSAKIPPTTTSTVEETTTIAKPVESTTSTVEAEPSTTLTTVEETTSSVRIIPPKPVETTTTVKEGGLGSIFGFAVAGEEPKEGKHGTVVTLLVVVLMVGLAYKVAKSI